MNALQIPWCPLCMPPYTLHVSLCALGTHPAHPCTPSVFPEMPLVGSLPLLNAENTDTDTDTEWSKSTGELAAMRHRQTTKIGQRHSDEEAFL